MRMINRMIIMSAFLGAIFGAGEDSPSVARRG